MDKMQNSLNHCIQENMTPYWRNHQSLKGKLHLTDKLRSILSCDYFVCLAGSLIKYFLLRLVLDELSDSLAKSIVEKERDQGGERREGTVDSVQQSGQTNLGL